jgi:hypothetical protein
MAYRLLLLRIIDSQAVRCTAHIKEKFQTLTMQSLSLGSIFLLGPWTQGQRKAKCGAAWADKGQNKWLSGGFRKGSDVLFIKCKSTVQ